MRFVKQKGFKYTLHLIFLVLGSKSKSYLRREVNQIKKNAFLFLSRMFEVLDFQANGTCTKNEMVVNEKLHTLSKKCTQKGMAKMQIQ